MISRRTSSIPKDVFPNCSTVIQGASRLVAGAPRLVAGLLRLVAGAPRLVTGAPRLVAGAPSHVASAPRCYQVHTMFTLVLWDVAKLITITSMVLLHQSSEIPVTPKAGWNGLLVSDTPLKLTRNMNLHKWYICQKNTLIFLIFYLIWMLQLS